jgi:hypothetical protein
VETIIPNPKEMPYILKNEPINVYVLLKPGFKGPTKFIFIYKETAKLGSFKQKITLEGNEPEYTFVDKMAQ